MENELGSDEAGVETEVRAVGQQYAIQRSARGGGEAQKFIRQAQTHLLATKPLEDGSLDFFAKCGRDRSGKPSGIRCPLMICCPTQATI